MKRFGHLALRFILVLASLKVAFLFVNLIGYILFNEQDVAFFFLLALLPGSVAAALAAQYTVKQRVMLWSMPMLVGCMVQLSLFYIQLLLYSEANPLISAYVRFPAKMLGFMAALFSMYVLLRKISKRRVPMKQADEPFSHPSTLKQASYTKKRQKIIMALAVIAPVLIGFAGIPMGLQALNVLLYASFGAALLWIPAFWLPQWQRWAGAGAAISVAALLYIVVMNNSPMAWFIPLSWTPSLLIFQSQICFLIGLITSAALLSIMVLRQYAQSSSLTIAQ